MTTPELNITIDSRTIQQQKINLTGGLFHAVLPENINLNQQNRYNASLRRISTNLRILNISAIKMFLNASTDNGQSWHKVGFNENCHIDNIHLLLAILTEKLNTEIANSGIEMKFDDLIQRVVIVCPTKCIVNISLDLAIILGYANVKYLTKGSHRATYTPDLFASFHDLFIVVPSLCSSMYVGGKSLALLKTITLKNEDFSSNILLHFDDSFAINLYASQLHTFSVYLLNTNFEIVEINAHSVFHCLLDIEFRQNLFISL